MVRSHVPHKVYSKRVAIDFELVGRCQMRTAWDPPSDSGDSDNGSSTAQGSASLTAGANLEFCVAIGSRTSAAASPEPSATTPQPRAKNVSKFRSRSPPRESISCGSSMSPRRADRRRELRRSATDDPPPPARGCEYWQQPLWHASGCARSRLPLEPTRPMKWELGCAGAGGELVVAKAFCRQSLFRVEFERGPSMMLKMVSNRCCSRLLPLSA